MSKKNKNQETFAEMCLRMNFGVDQKSPIDPNSRKVVMGTVNQENPNPTKEDWAMLEEMMGNRQGPGMEPEED